MLCACTCVRASGCAICVNIVVSEASAASFVRLAAACALAPECVAMHIAANCIG